MNQPIKMVEQKAFFRKLPNVIEVLHQWNEGSIFEHPQYLIQTKLEENTPTEVVVGENYIYIPFLQVNNEEVKSLLSEAQAFINQKNKGVDRTDLLAEAVIPVDQVLSHEMEHFAKAVEYGADPVKLGAAIVMGKKQKGVHKFGGMAINGFKIGGNHQLHFRLIELIFF